MMKQYTSLDRMMAALNFERPDRVPVFLNNALASSRAIGLKVGQILRDPERFAEALVTSYKTYGYDGVRVSCDVTVEVEAMGGKVAYPEDAGGSLVEHPIKTPADFDRLKMPNPLTDGRMPLMQKVVSLARSQVGDNTFIAATVQGPMNVAAQLVGVPNAMMMIFKNPEFLEKLLDFAVEVSFAYGSAMYKAGANCITFGEASCSVSMMGPAHYRRFVKPRHERLMTAFREAGHPYQTMHICGKLDPILLDVAETGIRSADIDAPVDMAAAREKLGSRLAMIGNVSPVELMEAPAERVTELAKGVLDGKEGLGLVLGAGCNMSPLTPPENIRAMVEAARDYGVYE
ncbi:MAG: uroporphyrinogen decarboxylase family protein [Candidatus Adiutrix sp.]|jgi:uroporphyrinogen decarboxylase|nr:uroporphyrinogen decarboxylase family protein [Candidatus Adiutrix sp.]